MKIIRKYFKKNEPINKETQDFYNKISKIIKSIGNLSKITFFYTCGLSGND